MQELIMYYGEIIINNQIMVYVFEQETLIFFSTQNHFYSRFKNIPKGNNPFFENEMEQYINGIQKEFKTKFLINQSTFQNKVFEALLDVKYGKIITYSDLALRVGGLNYTRAVAKALSKNEILLLVPCHRVVLKDGTIGGYLGGRDLKEFLLKIEGVKL